MSNTVNESAIKKLKLLVTVVDRPKGEFYLDVISQFDVNCQLVMGGLGTATSEIVELLGLEPHKAVILSVAREQGVRGGTILNARGVVNEDAAAFFGITLHADKEILMRVVEKDIRDQVLNAIYKEMGMAKKAKGIAFSLPVSDVAGLAARVENTEATE